MSQNPAEEEHLEVDHDYVDQEVSQNDEDSELTSLSSSITAYNWENGRRYHAYHAGKYLTPNDEPEKEREEMKHHWYKLILEDRLHLAPVKDPQHILDLGTGTGSWCIDMGDQYPSAKIIGTDLSKIQPSFVPENVQFEIDDWDDDWAYTHQFDFIHNRFNSTAVSNWPDLCRKSFAALKPGGWIELADLTNPPHSANPPHHLPPPSKLAEFFTYLTEGCAHLSRDLHAPKKWPDYLELAGFTNITERTYKVPIGGWPKDKRMKEAGVFEMETLREGLPAIGMGFFTRVLKWTKEEVDTFFEGVREELGRRGDCVWLPMYVTYAQKPFETTQEALKDQS